MPMLCSAKLPPVLLSRILCRLQVILCCDFQILRSMMRGLMKDNDLCPSFAKTEKLVGSGSCHMNSGGFLNSSVE